MDSRALSVRRDFLLAEFMDTIAFTKDGYLALQEELHRLKSVERPAVIAAIAEARAHGDLKENAEYHAAREKQGIIEARIAEYEDKLSRGEVVDMSGHGEDTVRFGAWVVLVDEESEERRKYRIVGDLEADIDNNKLSISSPIGRALLGKALDDAVIIKAPKGDREFIIESIEYT